MLRRYLEASDLIRTDGIVEATAREITKAAKTDVEKARALYEWIVDNTFRDPKVKGCGLGDIQTMLETRNLGGKCADLNALFVGFARSVGIPARDVYGIRVADSADFKSLGRSGDITKAQHCRAEFYLAGHGWVPVDPADVRKVVLEEKPGGLPLDDPQVLKARAKLFGAWEMNWMAYNYAHDVKLPGSPGAPVAFLMYPQAETGDSRRDSLDPDQFRYTIKSREIVALAQDTGSRSAREPLRGWSPGASGVHRPSPAHDRAGELARDPRSIGPHSRARRPAPRERPAQHLDLDGGSRTPR